jgi:hypothetical protein
MCSCVAVGLAVRADLKQKLRIKIVNLIVEKVLDIVCTGLGMFD